MPRLAMLTFLVRDYDEAINRFSRSLRFELIEDSLLGGEKRWVVMSPTRGEGASLLLARAVGERQLAAVGNQAGGRVFGFVETDDFACDYSRMTQEGVDFIELPRDEPYGRVAVFEDLYGNRWDLIEPV